MPPTAAKTATTTTRKPALPHPSTSTSTTQQPTNRTTSSGRAVRQNTTRPSNYYIKPYTTYANTNNSGQNADAEMADAPPPGFFPALTYFTDAISALPREVMRQFTLMKEVEAKVHGPNERLGEVVDAVLELPVPRKREGHAEGGGGQGVTGVLGLGTTNNSVTGSASVSLVNGVAPNAGNTLENSVAGSVDGGEEAVDEEMGKRQQFHELRMLTSKLLMNLDEKNVVLAEANRILAQQHMRLDSVLPHIDNEISEEARLGSMTHWAYSDNRQKKQATGAAANRRDVAATNSLAAAASAIHESDIAQARRDATRENAREKHKGRAKEAVDSDFDDKPKKTAAKVAKSKATTAAAAAAATGLGISANGEPVKKRKVDREKGLAAPGMERAASSKGKAAKETPRSTPNAETGKKVKAKPAPLPAKRKGLTSASPALASSPLHSSFNASETARPQSARLRQGSNATNLRHEKVAHEDRPTSAPIKSNGEKKRKAPSDGDEETTAAAEKRRDLKREHTAPNNDADADRPIPSRSHSQSHSGKAGRASAANTPRQESFGDDVPAMKRTRSTRSMPKNRDESSSEPQQGQARPKGGHKRAISNSHLVRQLAPFNRSPDLDRHRDDMEEDLDSLDGEARLQRDRDRDPTVVGRSPPKRRVGSRRGTLVGSPLPVEEMGEDGVVAMRDPEGEDGAVGMQESGPTAASSPPGSPTAPTPSPLNSPAHSPAPSGSPAAEEEEVPDLEADDEATSAPVSPHRVAHPSPTPSASPQPSAEGELDGLEEGEEEYDSDDPNEPRYCYCDRGSYGEMIACDNEQCPREWFHLGCTGLKEPPAEEEKWYCRDCAPLFSHERRGGRGGRGRGRGRG